ncbi:histidine phosphatase family protein [Sulfitobacter geojensis]|uniref:histidine phosphatase family protein n=1 Tax=Sulfitobacter geojensis TaxID=1342299 RepID=UPI00248F4725|nr:histidine phosphatase family protein [Sulfitobacter geojensis]
MAIYFIRHGQSEFNAAFQGEVDPIIFDAPLTSLGFDQAARARETIADLGVSRVITSPLTRAIQTAKTIFDGIAPIEVQHGHHELLKFSGDVGRAPDNLRVDFPDLSFDHLPTRWWHSHADADIDVPVEPAESFESRIAGFVARLEEIQNEDVAIVGHGNAFQHIIGFMLNNCQIHRYR